jgi:hypothetical protein
MTEVWVEIGTLRAGELVGEDQIARAHCRPSGFRPALIASTWSGVNTGSKRRRHGPAGISRVASSISSTLALGWLSKCA